MDSPSKQKLLESLRRVYLDKIENTLNEIASLTPSRDSETKNSAGDKHETSRAMMHIELDNLKKHLAQLLGHRNELDMIDIRVKHKSIEFGSVAITSQGNYFFSVGIGKVLIDGDEWFCVSMVSPVGQMLHSKGAGDEVLFNGKKINIQEVL